MAGVRGVTGVATDAPTTSQVTVSQILGEITWLITQSARHGRFPAAELSWLVLPPIAARQFFLFREGERPIGAALWGFPPPEAEARLSNALPSPTNRLAPEEWTGGGPLWLVDLIAPFATADNRHIELMLGDLMTGPFKGKEFRMLRIDPATGAGSAAVVGADAGQRLVAQIADAMKARKT
jgi:cytolysin-activating lysine-acyltransferase